MCLHEDMSVTVVSRHVLKEKFANVVGTSGDEVTSAKATTPSWKQLHPVSSSYWQTVLQHLCDNLENKRRGKKTQWFKVAMTGAEPRGFAISASCLASHHLQPQSERSLRSHDAGLEWKGEAKHTLLLFDPFTHLWLLTYQPHMKRICQYLIPILNVTTRKKILEEKTAFWKRCVQVCSNYNKVQNKQLVELC